MQHSFDVAEATKHGIEKAIILNNLRFWLEKNKANGANISNGYYWTFNSALAFSKLFPYMPSRSIARYLVEMERDGLIISSVNNANKLNRTKSYTMPEYAIEPICQNDQPICQNDQCISQNESLLTDINRQIVNKQIKDLKDIPCEPQGDDPVKRIFDFWKEKTGKTDKSKLDENRKGIIRRALKNYSEEDIQQAIVGCTLSPHHMGQNPQHKVYDGLELILRNAEKIEQFIGYTKKPVMKSLNDSTSWGDTLNEIF